MDWIQKNRKVTASFIGGVLIGGACAWLLLASNAGGIVLTNVPAGASVYVDNAVAKSNAPKSGRVSLGDIAPGEHTILVASGDSHWPWAKRITLLEDEKLSFNVFLLPVKPQVVKDDALQTQLSADPERASLLRNSMGITATKEKPILSKDQGVALWIEDQEIRVRWQGDLDATPPSFCNPGCKRELVILSATVPVRSLAFYGDRNDVILFAANDGIYALEIDSRGTQNFQPLYLGTEPSFTTETDGYTTALKHPILVRDTSEPEFFAVDLW